MKGKTVSVGNIMNTAFDIQYFETDAILKTFKNSFVTPAHLKKFFKNLL